MSFRLILDEMISPAISSDLWQAGIDNYAIRDRGLLGASDYQVWLRAKLDERTLVTINEVHFRRLAETEVRHFGIIVIPDGGTRRQQLSYVLSATEYARSNETSIPNLLVRVAVDCSLTIENVCAADDGSALP
jgi:predicted nuclease of predicted toxin-antitoxin system